MLCAECGKLADRACADCLSIGYCSEECQAADWSAGHYYECKQRVGKVIAPTQFKKKLFRRKESATEEPERVHEGQVVAQSCLLGPSTKVSLVGQVDAWEKSVFQDVAKSKKVQRLQYGNSLEADLILNQVTPAHHGACSDELARSLHISIGNDPSLTKGMPFAWANFDETDKEIAERVGKPLRLKTVRISHGKASSEALALIASRISGDAEVFAVQLSEGTALDFQQVLSAAQKHNRHAHGQKVVKGKIFLRSRIRVRAPRGEVREFLVKGQMTKLPLKNRWWLWVVEGRAVTAKVGEFDRYKDAPVPAALVLKARVEKDGHTISLPSLYFIAAA